MQIGSLQLACPLLLAPIAGYCDLPFRLVARQCGGVGLAFTDLLCPHGVLKQNAQTRWLMATCPQDQPLGMQLYGNDPALMAEAARWSVDRGANLIDINMGCPVDKVTKTFAGAMMLCTTDATLRVVEAVIQAVGDRVPVTAKTRLGYEPGELTAPALARQLVSAGIAALTIHGRTAAQRFKGVVDLDGIAAVVDAVHQASRNTAGAGGIPCIGNGDIHTPLDARRMIDHTQCDGVMIGRAALEAPWIFHDTAHYLATGQLVDHFSLRARIEVIRAHLHGMIKLRDQRFALRTIRQRIGWYGKYLGPCKPLKQAIRTLDDAAAFDGLLDEFLAGHPEPDAVPVTWAQRQRQLADAHASTIPPTAHRDGAPPRPVAWAQSL